MEGCCCSSSWRAAQKNQPDTAQVAQLPPTDQDRLEIGVAQCGGTVNHIVISSDLEEDSDLEEEFEELAKEAQF